MRIGVNLNRKFFVSGLIIGLLVIGFAGVYAYAPSVFGHDPNELDWTKTILSNVYMGQNLGVGTGNPGAKVHINGTGYAGIIAENSVSGKKFSFYSNDYGNLIIGDESASAARIIVNGSTGNVGIGTAAPTQKLDVAGAVEANGVVSTGSVNATQVCLSGDCKSNWTAAGTIATTIDTCQAVASGCSSCSDTTNCGSSWDYCAITDKYFRVYDNTGSHNHDVWRCRVYRSGGTWYVYAYYSAAGDSGGYMYCTATCFKFS